MIFKDKKCISTKSQLVLPFASLFFGQFTKKLSEQSNNN